MALAQTARSLLQRHDQSASPYFFLASIDAKAWVPRVIVVKRAGIVTGIVYAKERIVAGIRTGVVYGDATLDSMILAEPADRAEIFETALRRLLRTPGLRGLRLMMPRGSSELATVNNIGKSRALDARCVDIENHCFLDLPGNYSEFVDELGQKTRRNFRYYRRRYELGGHQYVPDVSFDDFSRAAFNLLDKDVVGAKRDGIERALRMLRAADKPILAGLHAASGEWLSILGGWYESGHAVVFVQMNDDRDHSQSSLCTVMRGYFIETVISQRVARILFWAGVGGPLLRYCRHIPTTGVYLDSRALVWRSLRAIVAANARFLPVRLGAVANWIAPAMERSDSGIA